MSEYIKPDLILPLKRMWFAKIWNGEKRTEYREVKPYWTKRIGTWVGDNAPRFIVFQIGYKKRRTAPAGADGWRRYWSVSVPWMGRRLLPHPLRGGSAVYQIVRNEHPGNQDAKNERGRRSEVSGFDEICDCCEYREMSYEPKADDYGQDPFGYYCNRREYRVERCPRAKQWREYFRRQKEGGDGK